MIKNKSEYCSQFVFAIKKSDILVYVSILVFLSLLSIDTLNLALTGDELVYAQTGMLHGIELSKMLGEYTSIFDQISYKKLVQFFSFFGILSLVILLFFWFKMSSDSYRLSIILILLIAMRVFISLLGGNIYYPLPPLSSLFPLIFGSVFGVSDLIFKLSYFLPYTAFIFILYKQLAKTFDNVTSYLFCLAFATVPIFWFLGSVVEISLWSVMCFSIVVLKLVSDEIPNYLKLIILVIIFSFFRMTAILSLVPILVHYLLSGNYRSDHKDLFGNFLHLTLPIIAFLPFLGFVLFYSTHYIPYQDSSGVTMLIQALFNGDIFSFAEKSFRYHWLVLVILPFLLPSFRVVKASLMIFAIILLVAYYSTPPSFWGIPKYQVEYILPFALTGTWLLLQIFSKFGLMLIGKIVILALLITNVLFIINFPANCINHNPLKTTEDSSEYMVGPPAFIDMLKDSLNRDLFNAGRGCNIMTTSPFDVKDAYQFVLDLQEESFVYSPGVHYGVLPQVMSGFDTKSIRALSAIKSNQDSKMFQNGILWTSGDASIINSDPKIHLVILDLVSSKDKIVNDLIQLGWSVIGEFKNARFGTSVLVLMRDGVTPKYPALLKSS